MNFAFESADRIVIGTIGMPGEREFFLQITEDGRCSSFALEKNQAAALAERMRELMKEVRRRGVSFQFDALERDDDPLQLPVDSEFRLGEMSLMWVEETQTVILECASAEEVGQSSLTLSLTLQQVREFIRRTEQVVNSGRAPCPFCGLPLNLDGHLCPRANGYRR